MNPLVLRICAGFAAVLLAIPAVAHAAQIDGDPLVVSSDDTGRIGAAYKDAQRTEFCCDAVGADGVVPVASQSGFVVVAIAPNGSIRRFGSRLGNVTLTSPPVVTGAGTLESPFSLTTAWQGNSAAGGPVLSITQELRYVNGQEEFRAVHTVQNLSGQPLAFRAATGADLAGGGADRGRGLFQPGPPRLVAGFNTGVGSVAGLAELTSWTHFEEGPFSQVLSRAVGDPRQGENLLDQVDPNQVDNGVAVQWDQNVATPLPPNASGSFEVLWHFDRPFELTPQRVEATTGDRVKFDVSLISPAGVPQEDAKIRWLASGVNSPSGEEETNSSGKASFEIVGANPGTDTVTAYADLNDNVRHDPEEPQREATVVWTGPDAPKFGKEVNLKPVSGKVLIRLPDNAKVRGRWAHAAQSRFVPLEEVSQVPVGADLDTKSGRVQLTSSTGKTGEVQSATFYSGRFEVKQSAREDGLTELRLNEPLTCQANNRGRLVGAASRSRKLWGNGKGRFRTRGRRSSATVRGTIWLQKDTCTTTTTTVRSGSVTVRDFAKGKNVKVKKGKRYVARSRR